MIDTCIFNKLLDGCLAESDLPTDGSFMATHIQMDEINNTNNIERRARLLMKFWEIQPECVPSESFVLDISRLDLSKPGDADLFGLLKHALDDVNNSKSNNANDALIAEVAMVNEFTLLTADMHLAKIVKEQGGKVVYFKT